MSAREMIYNIPETLRLVELKDWISNNGNLVEDPPEEIERVYFDTFDWRLYNSGSVLEISTDHPGFRLTWRRLLSGELLAQSSLRKIPQLANDLIAPGLREQLKAVLGVRALMPQITVNSSTRCLRLIDGDEKTTLRIELRNDKVIVPNSTKHYKLPPIAYVFPYRGYTGVYNTVVKRISERGRLRQIREDPMVAALEFMGVSPGSYSNSPDFRLDPHKRAYDELRKILDKYRIIMEKNVAGACEDRDPEFLHDFLHASRRTQCLVKDYTRVFPGKQMVLIAQDFDWIEGITESVRSLDIYLSLFDEFVTRIDADHRDALEPLRSYLETQKRKEQQIMRTPLESPRYKRLMEQWAYFLNEDTPPLNELSADARAPILEVASEGISNIYRELVARGSEIDSDDPQSAAEDLLELQVTAKRLGYEIETFKNLYPKEQIQKVMEDLKCLQDNLNSFHNLHLQHGSLLDYSKKMQQEHRTMPVWLEAIELLAADREREEHKMQREFQSCFKKLSNKKTRKRFGALFSSGGRQSSH